VKLKKAMMSLAAATAAGLCISAYAEEKGQSGTLNLTAFGTQFTESAGLPTTASWNQVPAVETISETPWFVIDCDAASSNEFAVTATTGAVVQCDFDLQVAPVPLSLRPASASGAQTAFCICTNATAGGAAFFCAWVSSDWVALDGFTVPPVDSEYSLRVTFDYKNGKYVKFSVKTSGDWTELYEQGNSTHKWFATGSGATGVSQYCFVGTGNVKSFTTAQADVVAESVDVGGKDVAVPEAQVAAVEALATDGGQTVAQVLAADANDKFNTLAVADGVTVADAIALGLIAPNSAGTAMEVKETSVKVSGNALAASSDIAINVNVAKPEGSNATITYTLLGSTDGSSFSAVPNYTGLSSVPTIPTSLIGTESGKYLFFKVKVSVTYPNQAN